MEGGAGVPPLLPTSRSEKISRKWAEVLHKIGLISAYRTQKSRMNGSLIQDMAKGNARANRMIEVSNET